jgi:hypothetical protein
MDFLEVFGEPLLELAIMIFSDVWANGSWEPKCKVQTIFGNDVWWN